MKVRTQFDGNKVRRAVNQGSFKSLGHAGAAIRLTAKRSIRKRKKPSQPGQPPHTQTGHMRRMIAYGVDRDRGEVAVGPRNEYAQTIWHLHEFGGTARPKPKLLKTHRFRVGEYGPIRKLGSKRFARVKLKSKAQTTRATRLVAEENQQRIADARRVRHYPKRPFMGPALEQMKERLPKFWKNSVRAT